MNSVSLIGDNAGWVIDNIVNDFKKYSNLKIVDLTDNPDIIWFVGPGKFFYNNFTLNNKSKIVVSIHHISKDKLYVYKFKKLSEVNTCIVPNDFTAKDLKKYTDVKIDKLPYWILSSFLQDVNVDKKNKLKSKLTPNNEILIGSFVKDGDNENNVLKPKLVKGPDTFLSIIDALRQKYKIKVILSGYTRNFIISNLVKMGVPYFYQEKFDDMNLLYDILDWYLVTSRCEGGPQSILEASYRKTKILSTNVGIANSVLHSSCICNNVKDFVFKITHNVEAIEYNYNNVILNHLPQNVVPRYDQLFQLI